jgi:SAM-dependent methyltransferase
MKAIAMRHKGSLDVGYFEKIYSDDPDPWRFETSDYERAKYDRTLSVLPQARFERVLEIGCANGVLTERLAAYCDRLVAVDVVDRVLQRARQRCSRLPNVDIRKASIPADRIDGPFDLILLSEVAYYWDGADIERAGAYFRASVQARGYILLVHWTGGTDYPKSGDEAVAELQRAVGDVFTEIRGEQHENYRLDLWRKRSL